MFDNESSKLSHHVWQHMLSGLTARQPDFEAQLAESCESTKQIRELEAERVEWVTINDDLSSQLDSSERRSTTFEQRCEQLGQALTRLEEELGSSKLGIARLGGRLEVREEQLAKMIRETEERSKRETETHAIIQRLEDSLAAMRSEQEATNTLLSQRNKELERLKQAPSTTNAPERPLPSDDLLLAERTSILERLAKTEEKLFEESALVLQYKERAKAYKDSIKIWNKRYDDLHNAVKSGKVILAE